MNSITHKPFTDSDPSVTLTVGGLRELLRQELRALVTAQGTPLTTENGVTSGQALASKPYLTIVEAADFARLAPQTIRLYIRKGRLKAQKVGRRVIVSREELEKFLQADSTRIVEFLSS